MSEVKVNKISPRTACGTVTLGDSGDTFTIPAGATITNNGTAAGFGATGAASWDTTVKTSSPFTAVSGVGYFVNTTAGAIIVNLPAGVAGDVVAIKDYAGTFDSNAATLVQNGSDKINGSIVNATLSTEGLAVTLVYVDATQGWLVTDSGVQSEAPQSEFIVATGGTITTVDTDYKVHTFTGPGTFTVCSVGNSAGSNSVDYVVAAGGGSGGVGPSGANMGGGGAGGGYREGYNPGSYTASPLATTALPVSATGYPIVVGAGAGGIGPSPSPGPAGSNSSFSTITSTGGGGGGSGGPGSTGGSGGGGGGGGVYSGAAGNTPPTSPAQGTNGGNGGAPGAGGGGGGATGVGVAGAPGPAGGPGGVGATSSISGSAVGRSGGGGGNGSSPDGAGSPCGSGSAGCAAAANRAGGSGGSHNPYTTGAGGSGVVIIRYKFQ
jgi:hypothetical protein